MTQRVTWGCLIPSSECKVFLLCLCMKTKLVKYVYYGMMHSPGLCVILNIPNTASISTHVQQQTNGRRPSDRSYAIIEVQSRSVCVWGVGGGTCTSENPSLSLWRSCQVRSMLVHWSYSCYLLFMAMTLSSESADGAVWFWLHGFCTTVCFLTFDPLLFMKGTGQFYSAAHMNVTG